MQYTVFTVGNLKERHDGQMGTDGSQAASLGFPTADRAAASSGHQLNFFILVTSSWQRGVMEITVGASYLCQLPQNLEIGYDSHS